ncbi:YcjX family protein [Epibacterium sp. SM1969]|uniref:YcjX family protein n=1 Tax=Tritonibacter aquimaris TaxID=2663379 RepID=A0A844AL68_9RHOB|nr:YcjX family protein [Tritonibacter aquimaris]
MGIGTVIDEVTRTVDTVGAQISSGLFDSSLRLGVTGLARSGKTVFITSLVAGLMNRGRMVQLQSVRDGRIETAYLQPQPDDTVPRFDYETHLNALLGPDPHWPESTRAISQLRLSLRVRPSGLMGAVQGARTLHLDIVDYPGEWLLDLGLLDKSFEEWSAQTLKRLQNREEATAFLTALEACDATSKHEEPPAQALAAAFTTYLNDARLAGYSDCTPGRFLLPGDLEGSPALTFAPLPENDGRRGSMAAEFARRFEAYKAKVVKPFFRDHFSRIDRQVVLVDALSSIHAGPRAVEDMRQGLGDILSAFRPGRNDMLSRLLRGRRVEKILFAATKADHLHHQQHPQLTAIIDALTRDARDRAQFVGAETAALSLAALRTTTEEMRSHAGQELPCVRGRLLQSGKTAAFYPGSLPEDPAQLLSPARQGAEAWLDGEFQSMAFAPAQLSLKPGDGPPHIRLDRAAEFLLGDRL